MAYCILISIYLGKLYHATLLLETTRNMAPGSVNTRGSRSTIKTASDVFDTLESRGIDNLRDARKIARRESGKDSKLADEVLAELENPAMIFSKLTTVPESLLKLMFETNTYLGGLQATSYHYAICGVLDSPWDFFCSPQHGDPITFAAQLEILTLSTKIEHMQSVKGLFDVYIFRKSFNGTHDPITMRVFVCNDHPLGAILDMKTTYQQSVVSAVGAVCFWPDLLSSKSRQYLIFEGNQGLNKYPTCKAKFKNRHTKVVPAPVPLHNNKRIYTGLSKTDNVMFSNVAQVDHTLFKKRQDEMTSMVYAVCSNSTKYLGHMGDM
jgi:hypothetical protein